MAQYIKSITYSNGATVNKVGSGSVAMGYPLNITVNGETYTRDPGQLDSITANTSTLSSRKTTASSTVAWASNTASFRVTGAYGNFSSMYSATQNLPIQLSIGNSSNIYARMNLSSAGIAKITFYCRGNTSNFSGRLAPLYVSSTAESSDPVNNGQAIQKSLVVSFNVSHSVDKGYGIMLWGNSQSPYINPGSSSASLDLTTPLGNLIKDAHNRFPGNVVDEVTNHNSVEGALDAFIGAGYDEGVVVFMPGVYRSTFNINYILSLIANGFDVIILDKPDLTAISVLESNDIVESSDRRLIFLELYPNTPNTYHSIYQLGEYQEYGAILSNVQDPSYLNTESHLQNRIVDFNITETSGSWSTTLNNFLDACSTYSNPPALHIIDITNPMYMVYTSLGSESITPVVGFEGNVAPLPENAVFISNIGVIEEQELLSSDYSSAILVNPDAGDNILEVISYLSTGGGSPNDIGFFQDSPEQSLDSPGVLFAFVQPLTTGSMFDSGMLTVDWSSTDVNTDNPFLSSN